MDESQCIDVIKLGKKLKDLIERMFTVEPMRRKAQLIQFGQFREEVVKIPEYEDLDLFRVFREFDENEKGFLDIKDYADCLEKFAPLGLNQQERTFIALNADVHLDGRIDYQEFMKHFRHILFGLKYNAELQNMYNDELSCDQIAYQMGSAGSAAAQWMSTQKPKRENTLSSPIVLVK